MFAVRRLAPALAVAVLVFASPALAGPPKVDQPAPSFRAITLDEQELKLADFRGQVVVLNLWATWCAPCRTELPLLDGYYKAQKKFGLTVLAVTTEDSAPTSRLKPLAAALSLTMIRRLRGNYPVLGGVPTNYIIDRTGVLRYAKSGAFTLHDLNELLVPLLREPPPDPAPGAAGNGAPSPTR